jgi:hypothetical protein
MGIRQCLFHRGERELCVPVNPLCENAIYELFGNKIVDLTGDTRTIAFHGKRLE